MSSGEKEKSPATFEERNPFDISRRSHTEVAGEIAKRMAAWKQARGRSYAGTTAAPQVPERARPENARPENASAEKRPHVSAPIQPTRAPAERPDAQPVSSSEPQPRNAGAAPEQRPAASDGTGRTRVPYFAKFSVQRAMPPAPSPRKPDASPQNQVEPAQSLQAPAMPAAVADDTAHHTAPAAEAPGVAGATGEVATEAGVLSAGVASEAEAQRLEAEASAWPPAEMLLADSESDTIEPAAAEASTPAPDLAESHHAPQSPSESAAEEVHLDPAHQIDDIRAQAPAVSETEPAAPAEAAEEIEDRREMARNMRARWIAAHDLDSPHLEGSSAPAAPEPEARDEQAAAIDATTASGPEIASVAPPTELFDEASGRKEPTFDAPAERSELTEPTRAESAARGLHETPRAERPEIPVAAPIAAPGELASRELTGRKEPTFDSPMRRDSSEPKDAVPAAARVSDEAPKAAIPIAALDALSGRKEPNFDEPAAKPNAIPEPTAKRTPKKEPKPAATRLAKGESGIKLRAIETRIEARRIETLRSDSEVSVGQPDIPHLERDEWDVPSPISTNRAAERHGWAIGLGAVLLIIGITAPAAIWQHDRQALPPVQDQVALDPALLPPRQTDVQQKARQQKAEESTPAPAPKTALTSPVAPETPATVPPPEAAAPQAPVTSAPQVADAPADTPPAPGAEQQTATAAAQMPEPTPEPTTLGAVQDGGQVDKVPVVTPTPAPKPQAKPQAKPLAAPVHLASRAPLPFATASGQPSGSEMVAKPFVPESDHFLRTPTTGIATVPIDGGSGAQGASVVVRPTLMAQLKPKPAGAKPFKPATQNYAPMPVPASDQSLDQMFQTLVDTLSEGKPANPATKPLPPSNRK